RSWAAKIAMLIISRLTILAYDVKRPAFHRHSVDRCLAHAPQVLREKLPRHRHDARAVAGAVHAQPQPGHHPGSACRTSLSRADHHRPYGRSPGEGRHAGAAAASDRPARLVPAAPARL